MPERGAAAYFVFTHGPLSRSSKRWAGPLDVGEMKSERTQTRGVRGPLVPRDNARAHIVDAQMIKILRFGVSDPILPPRG